MRTWSRGDKIAFWSLVVGAVSAYAAIRTIPRPPAEPSAPPTVQAPGTGAADPAVQQMLSQQEQFRQEQSRAARDEAIRIFEARMALRRERMEARKTELGAGGAGYSTLAVRNECNRPIYVAVHYMELDDAWITRGWWSVPPGQEVETDIATTNRYVALFAENREHGLSWAPMPGQDRVTKPVVDGSNGFDLPDAEPPIYPGARTADFFVVDVGYGFQRYVHSFTCTSPADEDTSAAFKLMG